MIAPAPSRIAFVAADGGLFASDHLPLVAAARELGLAVDVIAPPGRHAAAIGDAGAGLAALPATLDSLNPMTAGYAAGQLAATLKRIEPGLVHCVGLGPSILGGAACIMAGIGCRIYDLRDLGDLPFRVDGRARVLRRVARLLLGGPLRSPRTQVLVSGGAGARCVGLDPGTERLALFPASGVDPDRLRPVPMPAPVPLRVVVLEASGGHVAAEAAAFARAGGAAIELTTLPFAEAAAGGEAVWPSHHVACLPTGEAEAAGRLVLRAAASGRPIVCSDDGDPHGFVRDGVEGLLVPAGDVSALAGAFGRLARDPVLLPRMGAAARARVLHGFTERDLADRAKTLYAATLAEGGAA